MPKGTFLDVSAHFFSIESVSLNFAAGILTLETRLKPNCLDFIPRTRLYKFDPLKPQFYIVELGFTLFLSILLKNIDCVYSLEPPRQGGSNEYTQFMF